MANGVIYIIGAGPGSSDLITIRGHRAIKSADMLIIDSLLPNSFLDELGISTANKEVHYIKENGIRKTQNQINELMLNSALNGKTVARIKTGDPHIFGRGLEEQQFLSKNNIRWEYIPGISVFSAGTGLADMALTKREDARSFAVVTARSSGGDVNLDLPKADSLVIFMGVAVIDKLIEKLFSQGWNENRPATILEKACMPFQKQVSGNLANIANLSASSNIQAPAILIVGPAAKQYDFDGKRPRILFTGLDPANFRTLGKITHWPSVKVKSNKSAYETLPAIVSKLKQGGFSYIVITSKISAKLFLTAINDAGTDSRFFANAKVIAAGKGTAETLSQAGINADIVPKDYGSRGILEKIENLTAGNVLIVQSATATETMANSISKKLGSVTHLKLHEVVPNDNLPDKLPQYDIAYFTCPSGVRAFYEKYGNKGFDNPVWCIGDVTQKQLEKYNVKSKVVIPYVS